MGTLGLGAGATVEAIWLGETSGKMALVEFAWAFGLVSVTPTVAKRASTKDAASNVSCRKPSTPA